MKAANTTGTSGTINSAQIIGWFPLAMKGGACAMTIAKDIGFAIWSRNQLHKYFRHQASRSFNVAPVIRRRVPPPPPIVMPPLIPTQP
jgi:hypothetical protein